jgi:beta-fructofuranosidase
MDPLNKANQYVYENKAKIIKEFRHSYHLMPPIGWLNDPNGFVFYRNQYHLFYQYHPYNSLWGSIHWGHAVSVDLVNWKDCQIAMAPDKDYDISGVFSGSSFVENDRLYICYTGQQDKIKDRPDLIRQVQAMAYSEDGINFIKYDYNPIITTDMLPKHAKVQDFRDPKLFKKDDVYYIVAGSRNEDNSGQLLIYSSKDLKNWEYKSTLSKSENKIGKMWECPDFFALDGKDMILISPQELQMEGFKYNNIFSSIYMIGQVDERMEKYTYEFFDEIDSGLDFYAPQTLIDSKGRRIMIAWMSMWGRDYIPNSLGHGWAGAMTLPRELKIMNNHLYQTPIKEIENYRKDLVEYNSVTIDKKLSLEGVSGQCIELELTVKFTDSSKFVVNVFEGEDERTSFILDVKSSQLTFDRRESGELITGDEKESNVRTIQLRNTENGVKLRFFLDRSSVELFINDGEATMTSLVYPKKTSDQVSFLSYGIAEISNIKKWTLR